MVSHYNRGVAYSILGINYLARAEFDQAISIDSQLYLPWLGRAEVNLRMQKFELAKGDVQKALSVDPPRADVQNMRALIAAEAGDNDELLEASEKLVQINPGRAECYERRAQAYVSVGQIEEASVDREKAASLEPSLASAWALKHDLSGIRATRGCRDRECREREINRRADQVLQLLQEIYGAGEGNRTLV